VVRSTSSLLILLVYMTRDYQVTDERDKVFAMLGILDQVACVHNLPPLPMKADYESVTGDVFLEAATTMLEDTKSLNLLAFVPHQRADYLSSSPSWVPDFATQGPNPLLTLNLSTELPRFDACRIRSKRSSGFSISNRTLFLTGIFLGDSH
jgi:hypothetical protein